MAFSHYTDVTIQSSQIDSDLTDFLVTINGSDLSADFFSTAKSDGGDVRAYDVTETTEYPIHIAFYDNVAETARIIVRNSGTTSSSSNTVIRLMYGDAALSLYARDATYGAEAVYVNCKVAASLADGTSDYTDYASDNLTSITGGTPTEYTTDSPWDGNGVECSANGEYVGWTSVANTRQTNDFTWTLWHKCLSEPVAAQWDPVLTYASASNPAYGCTIQRDRTNDYYRWVKYVNNSTYAAAIEPTATYTTVPTAWLMFAVTQSSTVGMELWINGVSEAYNTATNGTASTYNGNVDYSSDGNDDPVLGYWKNNHYSDGVFTAAIMWDSVLSDDFITALYRNEDATASFYTIGTHTATSPPPSSAPAPIVVVLL